MVNEPKQIQHLAFPFYSTPALFFSLVGLLSSFYLIYIHYRNYTDPAFSSICAITQSINCDTVAQSAYSILLNVPLALWGIIFFTISTTLIAMGWEKSNRLLWILIFYLGLAASIFSIYLGYVSAAKINSYCIFCVISYLSFFFITFYSLLIIRRFLLPFGLSGIITAVQIVVNSRLRKTVILGFSLLLVALPFIFPRYWDLQPIDFSTRALRTGTTEEGNPWIGSETPTLTITVFSDYQCFQCYKMHLLLSRLVAAHPEKYRIVIVHFPLDHKYNPAVVKQAYHVGSGDLALLAIEAASQGKFWQTHEALYTAGRKKGSLDIRMLTQECGLDPMRMQLALQSPANISQLRKDMKKGIEAAVNSTPTFLIQDKLYRGTIPTEIFKQFKLN